MRRQGNSTLEQKIINALKRRGRGCVFSNRDFFGLGPDSSVAWSLLQLKSAGKLRMLLRGLYEYPKYNKLLEEYMAPDMHRVAEALARKYKWSIQASGSTALQHLGLSTQLPLRLLYYSDGPNRRYTIRGRSLEFKHISRKECGLSHPQCELYVQAVKELGTHSLESPYKERLQALLTPDFLKKLEPNLPTLAERERSIIRKIIQSAP